MEKILRLRYMISIWCSTVLLPVHTISKQRHESQHRLILASIRSVKIRFDRLLLIWLFSMPFLFFHCKTWRISWHCRGLTLPACAWETLETLPTQTWTHWQASWQKNDTAALRKWFLQIRTESLICYDSVSFMHKSRPTCYIAYMHKAHHWQLSLILFLAKIWWGNSWSVPTAAAVLFGVVTCVFKTSRGEPLVKLRNNPSTFSRSSNLKCSFLLGDFLGPDWEKTVNKNHNGKSDLDGTFSLSDTDLEISDVETPNLFSSSEEEPPPDPSVFCKRIPENTRDLPVRPVLQRYWCRWGPSYLDHFLRSRLEHARRMLCWFCKEGPLGWHSSEICLDFVWPPFPIRPISLQECQSIGCRLAGFWIGATRFLPTTRVQFWLRAIRSWRRWGRRYSCCVRARAARLGGPPSVFIVMMNAPLPKGIWQVGDLSCWPQSQLICREQSLVALGCSL